MTGKQRSSLLATRSQRANVFNYIPYLYDHKTHRNQAGVIFFINSGFECAARFVEVNKTIKDDIKNILFESRL